MKYDKQSYTSYNNYVGNGNFVLVADPNALEEILRAEGKYPERDRTITPRVKWFTNQFNQPSFFANEYV